MRPGLVAALAALAPALVACGGGGRPATPESPTAAAGRGDTRDGRPSPRRAMRLVRVGRFHRPLYVTQAPGDPSRLFVVEKGGRVIVVRGGRKLPEPFLSLRGKVSDATEQGLVGMAFAPDYQRSRRLYVAFTDKRGDLRIVEYRGSRRDLDRVDRFRRRLVLFVPQPRPTHNGGHLAFGPDGLLYIGLGDGGGPGDPRRWGQNRAVLHGKILRIDPRRPSRPGRRRYRVPRSNPFVRLRGARPEIYAYGLRNPWRFSFDRATGALLVGDVGQERWEEISYRPRRRAKGANFGWSAYEGVQRYRAGAKLPRDHVPPIHFYGRKHGCAVTGGYVVRDPGMPRMVGRYVYGDFCSGRISSLVPRSPRARSVRYERLKVPFVTSFGEDLRGRLYVTSLDGPVYRLAAADRGRVSR